MSSRKTEMGAHAFQDQVEGLAAATQSRSLDMPRQAEVVTLHRASIVRHVSRLTDRIWKLRASYILAVIELPPKYDAILETSSRSEMERARITLENFSRALSTPTLIDSDDGDCALFIEGIAATWAKTSSDDGRYARRLAKKLRAAGEACDVPRLKLHTIIANMLDEISVRMATQPSGPDTGLAPKSKYDALFEESLAQYPAITAYLAR